MPASELGARPDTLNKSSTYLYLALDTPLWLTPVAITQDRSAAD
jgi:hypothetical protein